MKHPRNVVPFLPKADPAGEEDAPAAILLGKLCRKDFELWVSRTPDGTIGLQWWRWREDDERFDPLEDGRLTLDPAELRPLAELLASVEARLRRGDPANP
jgi:hypothetical protein